jgi:hypothetical protein
MRGGPRIVRGALSMMRGASRMMRGAQVEVEVDFSPSNPLTSEQSASRASSTRPI